MIRIITYTFLLLPLNLNAQFFFQASTAKDISDFQYRALINTGLSASKYISVDSISSIDITDGNAFSISFWQFFDHKITNKNLFSITSKDTVNNRLEFEIDSDQYLQLFAADGTDTITLDSEHEDSYRWSGKFAETGWFHFVITYAGGNWSAIKLYVNGIEAVFSGSGSDPNIYGPYDLKIDNLFRSGPFRFFQKELSSGEVTTLFNDYTPLLSTSITNLELEYTHENNTFAGSIWTVADGSGNTEDGTATGFDSLDLKPSLDHSLNEEYIVKLGEFTLIDNHYSYDDFNSSPQPWVSTSSQSPFVWYDATTNRTFLFSNRPPGLGQNREGSVYYYDHSTRKLSKFFNTGQDFSENGIVDTHPGSPGIVSGNNVVTGQERSHNTAIYVRTATADSSVLSFGNLSTVSTNKAYPSFFLLGSDLYFNVRHSPSRVDIFKSTDDGLTWDGGATLGTLDGGDAFYPGAAYHSTKIIIPLNRREGGTSGQYTENFLMWSADGTNWHNIDSSYSTTGSLTDSLLTANYSYHFDDSIAQRRAQQLWSITAGDTLVIATRRYTTGTATQDSIKLFYTTDIPGTFQEKVIPSIALRVVHVSGSTYDIFTTSDGSFKRYRTTDFFDTITFRETIATISEDETLWTIRYTSNTYNTNEVIFFGTILEATSNRTRQFLYVYDKTQ